MAKYVLQNNDLVNKALMFAIDAHKDQVRKGGHNFAYVFHPIEVAIEIIYYSGLPKEQLEKGILVAILHDVDEDTDKTIADIIDEFFEETGYGVQALSKDTSIKEECLTSKKCSLKENLRRLKNAPIWVQAVKLADRITNLKNFPSFWSREKIESYLDESVLISRELGHVSEGLNVRLLSRIQKIRTTLSIVTEQTS